MMVPKLATPEFSESLCTTRTLLYEFTASIDLLAIAHTLPLTTVVFSKPWKRPTKPKLKTFPSIGSVYSIRMAGFTRGVYGPFFKNSLMIDMSLETKSVNVKISRSTIHICGVKQREHGEYITQQLVKNINQGQVILEDIEKHFTRVIPFFHWVKNLPLDAPYERDTYVTACVRVKDKNKLRKVITGKEIVHRYFGFQIDEAIRLFDLPSHLIVWFYNRFKECESQEDVIQHLGWFEGCYGKRTITQGFPLSVIISPRNVMINCSFPLGFCLLKPELRNAINTRYTDFIAHFNSGTDHYVNIDMLATPEELQDPTLAHLIALGQPVVAHTIIAYESGQIMMSSKCLSGMRQAFYKFRSMIEELYPIIYDEFSTQEKAKASPKKTKKPKQTIPMVTVFKQN